MSIFLDTRGKASLGVGICDRCKVKYPIVDLHPDRNSPGLLVCDECNDELDPYRLPPRGPDNIILRNIRPDVDIST